MEATGRGALPKPLYLARCIAALAHLLEHTGLSSASFISARRQPRYARVEHPTSPRFEQRFHALTAPRSDPSCKVRRSGRVFQEQRPRTDPRSKATVAGPEVGFNTRNL